MDKKLDTQHSRVEAARRTAVFAAIFAVVLLLGGLAGGAGDVHAQVGTTFTTNSAVAPAATMTLAVTTTGVTIVTSSPVVGCPTSGLGTATVTYSCSLPPAVGIPQGTSISQTFSVPAGPVSETVTYNANGPVAAVMAPTGNHSACTLAGVPMCNSGCSTPHPVPQDYFTSICGPVVTTAAVVPGGTLTLWVTPSGEVTFKITAAPPLVGTCPLTSTVPTRAYGAYQPINFTGLVYTCGGGQSIPAGTSTGVFSVGVSAQAAPAFAAEVNDNASSANPLPSADGIPAPTTQTVTVASAAPTLSTISPPSGPAGTSVTLTGTNLSGATAVTFGSTPATTFTCGTATSCTATAPSLAAGASNVTVTTGGGPSNALTFTESAATAMASTPTANTPSSGATTTSPSGSSAAAASSVPVSYGSGWNLVGGPAGTTVTGGIGPLYSYQAGDTTYETVQAGAALKSGWGYWAYFNDVMSVTIATASGQTLSVPLPAGQWVMVGNPGSTAATVSGADVFYSYSAAAGYQATTTLGPGAAAWAYAGAGGTATIDSR